MRRESQPLEEENQPYYDAETDQAGKYQFDGFRHATPPAPDLQSGYPFRRPIKMHGGPALEFVYIALTLWRPALLQPVTDVLDRVRQHAVYPIEAGTGAGCQAFRKVQLLQ